MSSDRENFGFNRTNGVLGRRGSEKFEPTVKLYQIESKAIRSNYGDKHDSGGLRKAFEDVSKRCLYNWLTFFVLSMFHALSNKNRTQIIACFIVTLLRPPPLSKNRPFRKKHQN